jgi:hypothetical protein
MQPLSRSEYAKCDRCVSGIDVAGVSRRAVSSGGRPQPHDDPIAITSADDFSAARKRRLLTCGGVRQTREVNTRTSVADAVQDREREWLFGFAAVGEMARLLRNVRRVFGATWPDSKKANWVPTAGASASSCCSTSMDPSRRCSTNRENRIICRISTEAGLNAS